MLVINVKKDEAKVWKSWTNAALAQAGAATIHSLGRDELQNVLQRLPNKERYMQVCRLFRHLLPLLATSAVRLHNCPRLHATHARRISSGRRGLAAVCRCPRLRAIAADFASVQHLSEHSESAALVTSLTMSAASLHVLPRAKLSPVLLAFPSLRVLTLELTQHHFAAAVPLMPQCKALADLRLLRAQNDVTDMPGDLDLGALSACEHLTHLRVAMLAPADFAPRGAAFRLHGEHALAVARRCRKLTHVHIAASWNCLPRDAALGPEAYGDDSAIASVSLRVWMPPFVARLPHNDDLYNFEPLVRVLRTLPALKHLRVCSRVDSPGSFTSCGHRPNAAGYHVRDVGRAHGAFMRPNFLQQLGEIPAWPTLRSLHINLPVHPGGSPNIPLPPLSAASPACLWTCTARCP